MKKLALAAVFAATATASFAGSYAKGDVIMEAPVIVEQTTASSSASGVWLPLAMFALVAAAAAAN